MKKFNKLFMPGTKVKMDGKWFHVSEVHETRKWIKLVELCGSFQRDHISEFSNK